MLMLIKMKLILILVTCLVFSVEKILCQVNPCSDVFKYNFNNDEIFGIITIPTLKAGITTLNISIGSNGSVYNNAKYLRLFKSRDDTARDSLSGKNIQYILLLPKGQNLPEIKFISLNKDIICMGTPVLYENNWSFRHELIFDENKITMEYSFNTEEIFSSFSDWFLPNLKPVEVEVNSTLIDPSTISIKPRIFDNGQWLKELPFECGKRPIAMEKRIRRTKLILGGVNIKEGEFPWLVYMRYKDWSLLCGATLVSSTYIITAAHCVKDRQIVDLQFGKHNRFIFEEGSVVRKPEQIIIHPEYNNKAHADIALVSFQPVEFSAKIFPICIWPFGLKFDSFKMYGTVAGWGLFVDDGPSSPTPMKTVVPKVSLKMCRDSEEQLNMLATDHTFCAGGNYSGPCHGDSGSGFYFRDDNTWYLRGIVSHALRKQYSENCLTNYYAVYVDIAFYLDWMRPYITQEEIVPEKIVESSPPPERSSGSKVSFSLRFVFNLFKHKNTIEDSTNKLKKKINL